MYYLKSRDIRTSPEDEELVRITNECLTDSSAGLTFDAGPHKYYFLGKEVRSVSSVVESFEPVFEERKVAEGCSCNPKHPYFGMEVDRILELWHENRDNAAENGTKAHLFGESCCMFLHGRPDEIEPEFKDRITENGFEARTEKEEAIARWWNDLDTDRYLYVAKETRIYNPELDYAGTFDLLLYDRQTRGFALKDYKTNGCLTKSFNKHMKAPLNIIPADNLGKYTVQQNLYRIQLQNIGIDIRTMGLLWLKEDGTYEDVPIPVYDRLVRLAMIMDNKKLKK